MNGNLFWVQHRTSINRCCDVAIVIGLCVAIVYAGIKAAAWHSMETHQCQRLKADAAESQYKSDAEAVKKAEREAYVKKAKQTGWKAKILEAK